MEPIIPDETLLGAKWWVKNVKPNPQGYGIAYDRQYNQFPMLKVGDEFNLHWPHKHRGNANSPRKGDIIVLFQNINNKGVIITHVVVVLDEKAWPDNTNFILYNDYLMARRVRILRLSTDAHSNPLHDYSNVARGNACRLRFLSGVVPTKDIARSILLEMQLSGGQYSFSDQ